MYSHWYGKCFCEKVYMLVACYLWTGVEGENKRLVKEKQETLFSWTFNNRKYYHKIFLLSFFCLVFGKHNATIIAINASVSAVSHHTSWIFCSRSHIYYKVLLCFVNEKCHVLLFYCCLMNIFWRIPLCYVSGTSFCLFCFLNSPLWLFYFFFVFILGMLPVFCIEASFCLF